MSEVKGSMVGTAGWFALILLVVSLTALAPIPSNSQALTAEHGIITVPQLDGNRRFSLEGDWLLKQPGEEEHLQKVPSVAWKQGSGTYSLTLLWEGGPTQFEFFTNNVGTSYELWLNESLVGSSGRYSPVAEQSRPSAKPLIHEFVLLPGSNVLQVKISNFVHPRAGLWEKVYLASKPQLSYRYQKQVAIDLFMFGQLFLFSLLQLSLAIFSTKKSSHVWFALGIMMVALGNIMRNNISIYTLLPNLDYLLFKRAQIITYYLASGFFIYAFHKRFPSSTVILLARIFFWGCITMTVVSLFLPYEVIYPLAIGFFPIMFLFLMYRVWVQLGTYRSSLLHRSKVSAILQIIADILLAYGMSHDFVGILLARYDVQMIPYMTYLYVALYTVVLARDYILADKQTEEAKNQIILTAAHQKQQLANDLHDGVAQMLHALDFMTEGLLQSNHIDMKILQTIRNTSKDATKQLKHVIDDLNPIRFGSTSLESALHTMADRMQTSYGIETLCSTKGESLNFDVLLTQNLYYVYSEAVKNALSHAKPTYVSMVLKVTDVAILGSIENDGVDGATSITINQGHGVSIMRYRIELLGGIFDIARKNSHTLIVKFQIPRRKRDD
ncbi:histidine kinase [Sphaerochaeta sp.]|uniref:sensor histidine kinase n=2 Tax=Sphaerochaeta sp. TaxID=1972642 RepID=UPI00258D60F8|nr:histidine kinase [Sphaerochaeta sp.]MDD3425064.1 histidine kinase [Sphaerochaeta sp.]